MRYTIIIVSFFFIIISINIYDYFFKSVFEGVSNSSLRRQRDSYKDERNICNDERNICNDELQSANTTIQSLSKRNIQISSSLNDITNQSNSQKNQISKLKNDKIDIEDKLLKCKEMNNQNVASGLTQ